MMANDDSAIWQKSGLLCADLMQRTECHMADVLTDVNQTNKIRRVLNAAGPVDNREKGFES